MNHLVRYFLEKNIFVNLVSFLVVIAGLYTALNMKREAFPNINFDIVTVTTVYPGASSFEVEQLVTNPLEKGLKEVDGIDEIRSASIENRSGIIITLDPDNRDKAKIVDDIKSAVDRITDLPADVDRPIVSEIQANNQPVIEVAVSLKNPSADHLENEKKIKILADRLEDDVMNLDGVAKIAKRGWRNTEMIVEINPVLMERYAISSEQVINALKMKNINLPGGTITNKGNELIVRTIGEFNTVGEIENVFIRSNDAGKNLLIRDIARVTEGFEDAAYIEKANGKRAILLTVIKKESADTITLVEDVARLIDGYKTRNPVFNFHLINDQSYFIKRRLGVLMSNGLTGLVLVTATLFVFLGWRIAIMTALGIPVAFGISFLIMNYLGITLNLISMMGLIIVVGILVDDGIIICENIYRYMENGMAPYEAALKGTNEVISPVIATVTTTIAAFAPMLMMSGIMGKFVSTIPKVIIITLVSSLVEAFFVLPSHIYDINKNQFHGDDLKKEEHWFKNFKENFYLPVLEWSLKNRTAVIAILLAVFILNVSLMVRFGKFKLFPTAIEIFQIKITGDKSNSLEKTEELAHAVEEVVRQLPQNELENFTTRIGIIQKNNTDPFTKRGNNFGQLLIFLTPDSVRDKSTVSIINDIRKQTIWLLNPSALTLALDEINQEQKILAPGSKPVTPDFIYSQTPLKFKHLQGKLDQLEFEPMSGGPPVGKAVAIQIKGDDYSKILAMGEKLKSVMAGQKGIKDIGDDYDEGKDEIRLSIFERLASIAGVSVLNIASVVNTAYQGNIATKIKRGDEEIPVRVRFPEEFRQSVDSLEKIRVINQSGHLVSVSRLSSYKQTPGLAVINHLDGKRLVSITANVDETIITSREANNRISDQAKDLLKNPDGLQIIFGGENKDTEESMNSLGKAFLLALAIIYLILASTFDSMLQPLIILTAIPFSLIGVVIAFLTHNMPFSFLAFMGLVGLAGVVINDSIVLVDFANQIRKDDPDKSIHDVLVETGMLRLRPVILTSLTTVLGILPTAYGIGGKDPFLVPMALAFGWGLAFSTVLVLIIVPVLYGIGHESKRKVIHHAGKLKKRKLKF